MIRNDLKFIPQGAEVICDKSKFFDSKWLEDYRYKYEYTKLPLIHWSKGKKQILDSVQILYQNMIDSWWYPVPDCGYDIYIRS